MDIFFGHPLTDIFLYHLSSGNFSPDTKKPKQFLLKLSAGEVLECERFGELCLIGMYVVRPGEFEPAICPPTHTMFASVRSVYIITTPGYMITIATLQVVTSDYRSIVLSHIVTENSYLHLKNKVATKCK